jgi:hypothetical protein
MPFIILLRVTPDFYRRPLRHTFFNRSSDIYRQNQLNIFDNAASSQLFMKKYPADPFISLMFENLSRLMLYSYLREQQRENFYRTLSRVQYYSPVNRIPRVFNYRGAGEIAPEDQAFVDAQTRSMQIPKPPQPQFFAKPAKENSEISLKKLPVGAKLPLPEAGQMEIDCPISQEPIKNFVCVPTGSNNYQVYEKESILELCKRSENRRTFSDPMTRAIVNIKDLFSISNETYTKYVEAHQNKDIPAATPPRP